MTTLLLLLKLFAYSFFVFQGIKMFYIFFLRQYFPVFCLSPQHNKIEIFTGCLPIAFYFSDSSCFIDEIIKTEKRAGFLYLAAVQPAGKQTDRKAVPHFIPLGDHEKINIIVFRGIWIG